MIPRRLPGPLTRLAGGAKDTVSVAGFRFGWGTIRRLPAPLAYRLFDTVAAGVYARGGKGVRRLRGNYARVRPDLDQAGLEALVRDGLRSYMRYYCEAFRLPDRTREELTAATDVRGADPVRAELATGSGVVVFVGHCGNYDQAGAWAAYELAPVTTVAERIEPEEVFREFLAFREQIGMSIIPLTGGDTSPMTALREAVGQGRFVCLAADRDLTRRGVEVDFFGERARMARGPAVLALDTGAPLHAASVRYEAAPGSPMGGHRTVIEIGPRLHSRLEPGASTEEHIVDLTQQCADHLAAMIAEHTSSWHMLQRVFVADLEPREPSEPSEPRESEVAG